MDVWLFGWLVRLVVGCLVGWLAVGWLVGCCLVGRLVGWLLVGSLVVCFFGWLLLGSLLVGRLVGWWLVVGWLVGCWLVGRLLGCWLVGGWLVWLVGCWLVVGWLVGCLVLGWWLVGWLVGWSVCHQNPDKILPFRSQNRSRIDKMEARGYPQRRKKNRNGKKLETSNSGVVLGWILEENGVPTWTLKSRKIKKKRFKKWSKNN
jgi:hypothetical protein